MRKVIYVPGKAISVNSTYYGNKSHGMVPEAKNWFSNFLHYIESNSSKFSDLKSEFDPKKHSFKVGIVYFVPQEDLYNKQGLLSSRTVDLSNIEKSIVDAIFLPKYSEHGNLDLDDKYLTQLSSQKQVSPDGLPGLRISITIVKKP